MDKMNTAFGDGAEPIQWLVHDTESKAAQIREQRLTQFSRSVNKQRFETATHPEGWGFGREFTT
jgi:hypothetical protein